MQVEPRLFPVALNGALGHAANIADFGDRESAKILEIDEVREEFKSKQSSEDVPGAQPGDSDE